jgi:hypothetical protein
LEIKHKSREQKCSREFYFPKKRAGAAITHEFFIADTRRCAQFSLGAENLIHRAGAASDF